MFDQFTAYVAAALTLTGYALTLVLIVVVLMTKKRQEVSTVAWIMAIVMLPYIGALLFLVFGMNRLAGRVRHRQRASHAINQSLPALSEHHLFSDEQFTALEDTLAKVAHRVAETMTTDENRVLLLHDTAEAFREIETALRGAKESIHLEYYIWQPDRIGTKLRNLLIEKAKGGVEVRFLYDTIGSMRLNNAFLKPMRDAGIDVVPFSPGQKLWERWSINFRNHRKIIIVDGATGFTGGMNVGDEYLGRNPLVGRWVDTHLRLEGPTVLQLQQVFVEDWYFATGEELTDDKYFPPPRVVGNVLAQVVAGGPDLVESTFQSLMFTALNEARQHITLVTSYFVPTNAIVTALEAAAYRGVRTRLLVSGPRTKWHTYYAGRSYYDSLLLAGVEIWEFEEGRLHSKTLTVDNCWSLVGSPNLDARSMFLNFEVAVALYDQTLSEQLIEHFENDIRHSRKISPTEWFERPRLDHIKENWSRMFSPVL